MENIITDEKEEILKEVIENLKTKLKEQKLYPDPISDKIIETAVRWLICDMYKKK